MSSKLTLIELNEFNFDLLKDYALRFNLKNLKSILEARKSKTKSIDKREHFGLDPWVQWVSIHTGVTSDIHRIKSIGEGHNLKFEQIWEVLEKNNISTGIWGVMNGAFGKSKFCKFFIPDPWSYSQSCYPQELNQFLALPRFYSKNYIKPNLKTLGLSFLKTFFFFLKFKNLKVIREDIFFIFNLIFKNGINNSTIFSIFDLLSTLLFIEYRNNFSPDFTILFLNSVAHHQHHHWDKSNRKMLTCLKVLDRIIFKLKKEGIFDDTFIIANGLGQEKTLKDYYIYRQKRPESFFRTLGIEFVSVEQSMTNDGQMFLKNKKSLQIASKIIESLTINNENLFHINIKINEQEEIYTIFYQLDYIDDIKPNTYFYLNNKRFLFYKHFIKIANRTGSHMNVGNLLYENIKIDKSIYNHNLFNYILNFFKI